MSEDASLTLKLAPRPAAAAAARRALATLNADRRWFDDAQLADAELLTSELVTNAVRHGEPDTIELRVYVTTTTVKVEVHNRGSAFAATHRPAPSPAHPGGRGLPIVERVAERWGIEPHNAGVCVWFELNRA